MQLLISFFLWQAVFDSKFSVFQYSREQMITYVLMTQFIRPLVFASRAINVAEVISSGDLTNIILKPISFLKYYFVRDIENKLLNFSFAVLEFSLVVVLFKPVFSFRVSPTNFLLFVVSLTLSILIFFFLNVSLGFLAFWIPENAWAPRFLFFIFFDFFSGSLFPLDIFTGTVGFILRMTPFYYLLFFPLSLLLGRFDGNLLLTGLTISVVWVALLYKICQKLWRSGLAIYGAWGR